jgi:hypothetical protein
MRHLFYYALATALPVRRQKTTASPSKGTAKKSRHHFLNATACLLLSTLLLSATITRANNVVTNANGNWSASSTWIRTMTGTISVGNNATAVTGVGTSFTTELSVGSVLWLPDGSAVGTVSAIGSNTTLTLAAQNSGAKSGVAYGKEAIPLSGDVVVINNGNAVVLNQAATVASLEIIAPSSGTSQLSIGAFTLHVTGNLTVDGSSLVGRSSKLVFTSATGVLDVDGNVTIGTGGSKAATAIIDMSNAGNLASTMNVGGNMTEDPSDGSFVSGSASLVIFDGSTATTMDLINLAYANVRTANSGGITLNATATSSNLSGTLTVSSGIFNTGNFAMSLAASKNIVVSAGATLNAGTSIITVPSGSVTIGGTLTTSNLNGVYGGASTTFAGTPTFNLGGSTIDYNGAVNQKVTATGFSYINLAFSNGGKIIGTAASQILTVLGNLAVGVAANFSTNNTALNVSGDVTGSGTITKGTATLTVAGNWLNTGTFPTGANMSFTSNSSVAIPSATYGTLSLSGPKTLSGDVTATTVALSGSAKISLGSRNLTANSITGASATDYFVTDGSGMLKMPSTPGSSMVFPVGPTTASYTPVTVTPSAGAQTWSVRVQPNFNGYTGTIGAAQALPLVWMVNTSLGSTTSATNLVFQYDQSNVSWSTPLTVDVYHFDANGLGWAYGWQKIAAGVTPGTSGSIRTVSVSNQTMFSPFAIQNPAFILPVNLTSFTGKRDGSVAVLNWTTAQEYSNKNFSVQRSFDGRDFETICVVNSLATGGNSNEPLHYSFNDNKPGTSKLYYRLLQQDINGKTTISSVIQLQATVRSMRITGIYMGKTNKGNVWLNVAGGNYSVVVADLNGNRISQKDITLVAGDNKIEINIPSMMAGVYFLTVVDLQSGESVNCRFVK